MIFHKTFYVHIDIQGEFCTNEYNRLNLFSDCANCAITRIRKLFSKKICCCESVCAGVQNMCMTSNYSWEHARLSVYKKRKLNCVHIIMQVGYYLLVPINILTCCAVKQCELRVCVKINRNKLLFTS